MGTGNGSMQGPGPNRRNRCFKARFEATGPDQDQDSLLPYSKRGAKARPDKAAGLAAVPTSAGAVQKTDRVLH